MKNSIINIKGFTVQLVPGPMEFLTSKILAFCCTCHRVIKSRRLRWAGHFTRMEEGRSAFHILASKPTGKRSLGRLRRGWEDNTKMDLKEISINTRNWVDSVQYRDY